MIICDSCGTKKPTKNYCSDNCRVKAFRVKVATRGVIKETKTLRWPQEMEFVKPCKHGVILGVGSCKFGCV